MKYLTLVFTLLAFNAIADHRMDYGEGCHFVKPSGIAAGNNGDEIKSGECPSDIITNADGTRTGSAVDKRSYAPGTLPILEDYTHTSDPNVTNIVCNMDDGNNTYQTKAWTVTYDVQIKDFNKFKKAYGTEEGDRKYNPDFDFNDDGVINTLDLSLFRAQVTGKVKYTLACRNGVQQ